MGQKCYAYQSWCCEFSVAETSFLHALSSLVVFRFSAVQKHTVEFNQLAMANSEGSEAMLNRVMTKDNIGVAVLLEVRKEMIEVSCECPFVVTRMSLVNIRHWF